MPISCHCLSFIVLSTPCFTFALCTFCISSAFASAGWSIIWCEHSYSFTWVGTGRGTGLRQISGTLEHSQSWSRFLKLPPKKNAANITNESISRASSNQKSGLRTHSPAPVVSLSVWWSARIAYNVKEHQPPAGLRWLVYIG